MRDHVIDNGMPKPPHYLLASSKGCFKAAIGLNRQDQVRLSLLVEREVFGVLITARRASDSFSSGECEFLRQLSEHVALATHQAKLYSTLQGAYDGLRQTQQAVMQQKRLRTLGQMAGGVADDITPRRSLSWPRSRALRQAPWPFWIC